jgi:hypothetical protein
LPKVVHFDFCTKKEKRKESETRRMLKFFSLLCKEPANGWRYRQARGLGSYKTHRRRIRHWGRDPESAGNAPHLSGARGVGRVLQDDLGFAFVRHCIYRWVAGRVKLLLMFSFS